VHDQLWQIAEGLTPVEDCNHYTQAMMDLGATLCTRSKPDCPACPLSKTCQAFAQGNPTDYPGKKPKSKKPVKETRMLMITNPDGHILLQQRPPSGIWGGLWCFPEISVEDDINAAVQVIIPAIAPSINKSSTPQCEAWQGFRHTFSHYHLDIEPVRVTLDKAVTGVSEGNQRWVALADTGELGLAAPVVKLLKQLHSGQSTGQTQLF
jgi:A/G-specific adenine glycosylase